jgi:hypothetical protein
MNKAIKEKTANVGRIVTQATVFMLLFAAISCDNLKEDLFEFEEPEVFTSRFYVSKVDTHGKLLFEDVLESGYFVEPKKLPEDFQKEGIYVDVTFYYLTREKSKSNFPVIEIIEIQEHQPRTETRITGGFPINIENAPWQVLLSHNNVFACGGSIIAPNFILTAKHCVTYVGTQIALPANLVKIHAGITCRNEISSSNTFDVSNIILHPDPNVDIALVQLSSNIPYNNNRQPINFRSSPNNTFYNVGNSVRASGWGWTIPNNGNSTANCLQAVDLSIVSNQTASSVLRHIRNRDLLVHEMAATGSGNNREGACHGDSGGPLIAPTLSGPQLVGVVSWGVPECKGSNQNSPSVFVRVSHVSEWILDRINAARISGSTVMCPGQSSTFTISNLPSNATVVWTHSPNLQLTGSTGATVTFRTVGSQEGWIEATVNGIPSRRHNVWVGVINVWDISTTLNPRSSGTFYAAALHPTANEFEWSVGSGWQIGPLHGISDDTVEIIATSQVSPSAQVRVRARNACGWSDWVYVGNVSIWRP